MSLENKTSKSKNEIIYENIEKDDLSTPKDTFYSIYILFFFLGVVHYIPWSFFNISTGFWMYKFRNTSINETDSKYRTDLQAEFNASISIILQVTEVTFLIVGAWIGHLVKVKVRIIGILSIIFVFFVILTIFIKVDTDSWQEEFFGLVMAIVAGINSLNAIFTITIYTILSQFPTKYLAPYLTGTSLSKIIVSCLQILSLATGLGVEDSAILYFTLALGMIAFCIIFLVATGWNEFYLYHMRNFTDRKKEKRVTLGQGWRLLKKIWSPVVAVGIMQVTMNASPNSLVVSEGEGSGPWSDIYFIPTITYLLSGICELIGRSISFRFIIKHNNVGWVLLTFIRMFIIVPLYTFCNAQPRHHLPVLLPHDYQYILVLITSNVTGAYIMNRTDYIVKSLVSQKDLKDAFHVNNVVAGLLMGALSFISVLWVKIL